MSRKLRYSFKTIFSTMAIISAATAFVVQQLNWIAERERAITWMEESSIYWAELGGGFAPELNNSPPFRLRLFGAPGVGQVTVIAYSERTIQARSEQLTRLFPEADITVFQLGESPGATIDPPWN